MSTLPLTQSFTHQAMNTEFHLRIANRDPAIVAGMAKECFDHLDFIESRLSRYIDDSDVSRMAKHSMSVNAPINACWPRSTLTLARVPYSILRSVG